MEVGLSSKIPTYSGGLGVLAGDLLKTAADLGYPMVGVTLLNTYGYFYQAFEENRQVEVPVRWSVDDFFRSSNQRVTITIAGEEVTVGCWIYTIEKDFQTVPIIFLTTDLEENSPQVRDYTHNLYGSGTEYRFAQEMILGIGGVKMLKALGFDQIENYHINEGHAAMLTLELMDTLQDKQAVRDLCIFTTHTPVPAGHDIFSTEVVDKLLSPTLIQHIPDGLLAAGTLNMTKLALEMSRFHSAVSKKHKIVTEEMFPNYTFEAITNGAHVYTWAAPVVAALYDEYIPGWRTDPQQLTHADAIPLERLLDTHRAAKQRVIDYVNATINVGFDYDDFTIIWSRRFTAYKRPLLLLEDIEVLRKIANRHGRIQIIYAGKSHPLDIEGKQLLETVLSHKQMLDDSVRLTYVPNYDMYVSALFVAGADVWLNTPMPGSEASATSGMKAAFNGVPQLSINDGWWLEGYVEGKTGWRFDDASQLYSVLDTEVLPCFYKDKERWASMMRSIIQINGTYFNSTRMLREYIEKAYA